MLSETPTALQLISVALAAVSWIFLGRRYGDLPERIPIHFGLKGTADNWGRKAWLWMCPVLSLVFAAGVIGVIRLGHSSAGPAPPVTQYMLLALQAMMLSLEVGWVRIAAGERSNIWPYLAPFLLVIPAVSIVASRLA